MRILPAALYFAKVEETEMKKRICEISCITHGHPRSQLACCLYAIMVKELLIEILHILNIRHSWVAVRTNVVQCNNVE
ncbi:ADP-ribosylglycohydrolase family protein [Desulfotomaculum nigrificans]|uniref:ADP-ribosylglycohydrolase family protein n=1 Tax=Desulfotomaculum nigrificans TaxID=1565 RepID=UPI00249F86DC|nr:ADP-ribosylglycohydrolase family protein [Desulfotomaculum nigrificans]